MVTLSHIFATAALVALPFAASAAPYTLDNTQSHIRFSGTHAGQPFNGQFKQWQAAIEFDAANLAQSKINTTIQVASAYTGNVTYDGTLPTADWLNVAQTPTATFVSHAITAGAQPNQYVAAGTLSLRGKAISTTLPFTLTPVAGGAQRAVGTLALDRLAFGIGASSDPKAEWVGRTISVTIDVVGTPTAQ